jgi:Putative quorum-sensing-regulated virulence factor
MQLTFGKYEGQEIEDVPHDYLLWLYRRNRPLQAAIERELGIEPERPKPKPEPTVNVPPGMLNDLIEAGFRALALKQHPDHGGDTKKMQELNATRDRLRRMCARA